MLKSAFKGPKVGLKKKYMFGKKIESSFKGLKVKKLIKRTFSKSLKIKFLPKNIF
jgi:hypothetical protein